MCSSGPSPRFCFASGLEFLFCVRFGIPVLRQVWNSCFASGLEFLFCIRFGILVLRQIWSSLFCLLLGLDLSKSLEILWGPSNLQNDSKEQQRLGLTWRFIFRKRTEEKGWFVLFQLWRTSAVLFSYSAGHVACLLPVHSQKQIKRGFGNISVSPTRKQNN